MKQGALSLSTNSRYCQDDSDTQCGQQTGGGRLSQSEDLRLYELTRRELARSSLHTLCQPQTCPRKIGGEMFVATSFPTRLELPADTKGRGRGGGRRCDAEDDAR
eukprot:CAMPEP_0179442400 /NCGR_PEP_ID=MMETSP0799-20121207/25930_1 /TAXON_ID=46947 /ORGANISM="Geminigera cryophila, Strain CCMP2564" /LENGTH=104 /DNA_ID=CAMNT_0021227573 /DNA_START=421 /DNA_END=731 /DNA_ORIENTATION=-